MDWWVTAVGAGVVAAVLRDVFHTLWHPSGQGSLSRLVLTTIWRLFRHRGHPGRLAALTGPLAMVAVVGTWGCLVVVGWTLVYWPHVPEGFLYGMGLRPSQRTDLFDALYLSLVTVATLGFGDIVPVEGWLRVAVPLQAVVGFALLTAAVSWVLQIYPALTRRRALALRLSLLRRADTANALLRLDSAMAALLLDSLAAEVVGVRIDLSQYAETYYFRDSAPDVSLAAMAGYAAQLAECGQASAREDVRLAAAVLDEALDDLTSLLDKQFLRTGGTAAEILDAYAADHEHSSK